MVTPEELNAWLHSTEVTEGDESELDAQPTFQEINNYQPQKRKVKPGEWRRRSSLDEENISERPCFGLDAETFLFEGLGREGDNLNPHLKFSSQKGDVNFAHNNQQKYMFQNYEEDFLANKKRRVTPDWPENRDNANMFSRKCSSYSQASYNSNQNIDHTLYSRLVTDDNYNLDHEAQYSRRSSQFTIPSQMMDQEARYSRRASQFKVCPQSRANHGFESFLDSLEVSKVSQDMLLDHSHPLPDEYLNAMKESEMSRSLLMKLSRRNVLRTMENRIEQQLNQSCGAPVPFVRKQYVQERVAVDIQVIREKMKRAKQEEELMRHGLGFW
jgi:hypothetical protein